MQTPSAILFDLDDTLLDTTLSASRAWAEAAEYFADEIGQSREVFEPILEASRKWYWSDPERNRVGRRDVARSRIEVTVHGLRRLGIDDPDLAERFSNHYTRRRVQVMSFFEGALETLEHFRERGVPMALITNGDATHQRDKVAHFDLEPYFEAVLIEGELGYGKPDRRVFEAALEACGVGDDADRGSCWCVGDSLPWEVAGAQAVGLCGVWNDWRGVGLPTDWPPGQPPIRPDRIVQRVDELIGSAS